MLGDAITAVEQAQAVYGAKVVQTQSDQATADQIQAKLATQVALVAQDTADQLGAAQGFNAALQSLITEAQAAMIPLPTPEPPPLQM